MSEDKTETGEGDAYSMVSLGTEYLPLDADGDLAVLACDLCGCLVRLPENHRLWHDALASGDTQARP